MTTALPLFYRCRRAGIALEADGDAITFDAPPGVIVPVDELRDCKPELLAVLRGDYLAAALALVLSVADPDEREGLAYIFDEREAICECDGGMSRGEAQRQGYMDLTRAIRAAADEQASLAGGSRASEAAIGS